VAAALALIDREGTAEAVTLRAVAREIGIAAPSIYAHFTDRDAIVAAVTEQLFDDLTEAIRAGITTAGLDPVGRLVAGCEEYVRFGLGHPARYGVLFAGPGPDLGPEPDEPAVLRPGEPPTLLFGMEAFALLPEAIGRCVAAGSSASTDVVGDAIAVWVALHGTVTLRVARPRFPWPESVSGFVRQLVLPLAKITVPA